MNPALQAIQKRRAGEIATRIISTDESMTFMRSQDCTPIAEYAKAQHNAGMTGSADVKHAARLPLVIVEHYCNENGITFAEFMQNEVHVKRAVKDPKNADFRIWKGNF